MLSGDVTTRSATPEKDACVNTRPRFSKPRSMSKSEPEANNSNDVYRCPWGGCSDTFDSKRSRSLHHYHAHGESLTRKTRECEVCGDTFEFYSSTIDQRTCSNQCAGKLRREWVELSCENCGDLYKVKPSQEGKSQYCSHECYWKSLEVVNKETCDNCGKKFDRLPCNTDPESGCYCSESCAHEGFRGELRAERVGVDCDQCGDTVVRTVSRSNLFDHNFCSHACYWENSTGPSRRNLRRHILKHLPGKWQEHTDQNRGSECEMCGGNRSDAELQLHHIIPIRAGGINEKWNYMTLCASCHMTVERFTEKIIGFDVADMEL